MQISKLQPLSKEKLQEIGLEWHTDSDNSAYISNELVHISKEEAQAFYNAGNELYDMYVEAGEYVLAHDLLYELDVPPILHDMVRQSWEEDIHWHLYGRFDLAGGLDGKAIKLLEFNADTPTMLYESAIIQWALLKHNSLDENLQFNNISESLRQNFKRLITLDSDTSKFAEFYEGWRILFSSVRGNIEEEITTRYLEQIAKEAGFATDYAYIDEVGFSHDEGVLCNGHNYEFLFKLIPWENIAIDESEMASLMREMMRNKNAIFLNPAYTIMFQSKRMLKILWDLFPKHPLLLESGFEPLGKKQVLKRSFGREGANIEILDSVNRILSATDGIYSAHKEVYQEFYELNSHEGSYYQANVFFAYESCGLGFRKGGLILDNFSKFVSHTIQ
ncbi:MAG: glutathionylspermidine synthase family protein [Helicobacter sp.]|uniref:glutathionylspermidine synthase family protein n=1 Tax=Helicobacter sp. 10-6591 TaxID=2004998 RepID=UPI000DCC7279|nr:glutathionylspermidine synthase family protein [Helicobacter sp. 10-6591]MCI6217514.1 glutathionylspermidine synthase family protein [Helicobacter sp.]MCI7484615.1 glutathionylspermidine synthase family protein [Helicobacter sp.]MDD7568012.1 glutathionylspermidine synthase family protein [Helicobacter sp.]MDY5740400.1 glutathionylspermidine synthase family protein [Helicobacter sp.]RAX53955.1 glutathionylspermidine synthase [Helicobacter sp. 10-6591]